MIRHRLFFLLTLLAIAPEVPAQQEWPQYLGGPGHAGFSLDESIKPPFKLLWSYRLDGDASGDAGAGVTVGGGLVYVNVNNTRSIVALDAHTGAFRWEYTDAYPGYKDVPSYADGRLILWERSKKPRVLALDAKTGKMLWQHPLRDLKFLAIFTRTGLAVDQGKVYLSEGGAEPSVQALDAKTGKSLWQIPIKNAGSHITPPSVAKGMVIVAVRSSIDQLGSERGAIVSLDAQAGKELWRRDCVPSSRPLFTDGADIACTLVKSGKLTFQLLDASNGRTRWSIPRQGAQAPQAMLTPDVVIMKTSNGAFSILDRKSGTHLKGFSGGTRSGCCVPAIAGSYAFWGTGTTPPPSGGAADVESYSAFAWPESPREKGIVGNMHAIDLKSGKSVWRFGTGNCICGDPALAYGRLYFTSRDGKVYCFAPAGKNEPTTPDTKDVSPSASPDVVAALLKRDDPVTAKSWPMAGGNPHRSGGVGESLKLPLKQAWKFDLGGRVLSSAALRAGVAVIGSDAGNVVAIETETGKKHWEFATGGAVRCTPAVASDTVYCGSDAGTMHALDIKSGKEKWHFVCGGPVRSSPAIVGGILLFGADDHHVYALDRETGKTLWRFRMRCHSIAAPVVVHGQQVFVGQWNDWVFALDLLTGKEQWRSYVPVSIEALAYYRDKLYVRSPYYILELDPTSDKRLRLAVTSYGYGGLGFHKDAVIQSGVKGQYGDTGATRIDLSPSDRVLKYPSLEGVGMLSSKRFPNLTELTAMTTPLVMGDQVCFATRTGNLTITSIQGKSLWSTELGGRCHSSPVTADGMLIVGCDDGWVYAFRGSP